MLPAGAVEDFARLLERDKIELAAIIARETGKPRWETLTEVQAMINKVAISVKAYHTRTGEKAEGESSLRHRPHGVLAVFGRITSRPSAERTYRAGAAGGQLRVV